MSLAIQPGGAKDTGVCPCCGSISHVVWGEILQDGACAAVYYVHWTKGEVLRHGAHFHLILGLWGEGTTAADRCHIAIAYRIFESGPSFMVIDAADRPLPSNVLAENVLARTDVIGTWLADAAFRAVDTIWFLDARIAELIPPESSHPSTTGPTASAPF